ncbi:TPA: MerR family transcriptional regulator [Enterococcus faecalis]|uniref:MerR family transcriptional regulator n=1 Tax=Enterococcus sp. DIV0086 TaxID=2774655 RepID=UPI001623BF61|nr:MerR family transcriptional regulator [Enterococcus faecalis]MBC1664161.1 MerR family transcriptional regulator [Listeria welshimeri]HBI1662566.1 MerR family transcriptional regulator [Enterococcus faecalis]HBI1677729.1 MerR family transcriptional regulator [Enterococcus faecalis]HBI1678281.1 MerR family transcriptional regulator [Enterococcus faecalis]
MKDYKIGEFAKILGVSVHTLRYYEKEGLIIPEKRERNLRYYSEEDRLWMEFLLHMKETGMSILDMKKYTELRKSEDYNPKELIDILIRHREKVIEQIEIYQKNLDILNEKISIYQNELGEDLFDKFKEMESSH